MTQLKSFLRDIISNSQADKIYSHIQKLHHTLDKAHLKHLYELHVESDASALLSVFAPRKARQT